MSRLKSNVKRAMADLEAERQETLAELHGEPMPRTPLTLPDPFDLSQITPMPVREESSMMPSAPPSRSGTGTGHPVHARTKVTLSKEEAELARMLGVSYERYALEKQELERQKAAGLRQIG